MKMTSDLEDYEREKTSNNGLQLMIDMMDKLLIEYYVTAIIPRKDIARVIAGLIALEDLRPRPPEGIVASTLAADLFVGVVEGDIGMAEALVKMGADIDCCNGDNCMPLLLAAGAGDIRMITFLLAADADVEHYDYNGVTALLVARQRRSTYLL